MGLLCIYTEVLCAQFWGARNKFLTQLVWSFLLCVSLFCQPWLLHFLFMNLGFTPSDLTPLRPFNFFCVTLNGLLNPLLNYRRINDVRRAVRSLIRCQRRCGEGRRIGDVDYGQRHRNLFPSRGNNRVTVDSHQVTEKELQIQSNCQAETTLQAATSLRAMATKILLPATWFGK